MSRQRPSPPSQAARAAQGIWRARIVTAVGVVACLITWAAIPCPNLVTPCGGPDWSRYLGHLECDIPDAMLEYADAHGGRFPDSLADLIGEGLYPTTDVYAAKREWESRPKWQLLRLGACGVVILWTVALRRPGKHFLKALMACASVSLVAFGFHLHRLSNVGPQGYGYLDFFRTLPGIQEPVPPDVPILWTEYLPPLQNSKVVYTLSEGWYLGKSGLPYDLASVHTLARADSVDVPALSERIAHDDAGACLVLALRREPGAADAFAQAPLDSNSRQFALWGLLLLNDSRTGAFALESLNARRPSTRAYAATVLARSPASGADAASRAPMLETRESRD